MKSYRVLGAIGAPDAKPVISARVEPIAGVWIRPVHVLGQLVMETDAGGLVTGILLKAPTYKHGGAFVLWYDRTTHRLVRNTVVIEGR